LPSLLTGSIYVAQVRPASPQARQPFGGSHRKGRVLPAVGGEPEQEPSLLAAVGHLHAPLLDLKSEIRDG